MSGDIKLKIRHAKRANERSLDLSGMDMIELPVDITQLTLLETLNISNNKLTNLKRIEQLPNLRELNASNNNIAQLHQELLDMYSIETIYLFGNPIVNSNPQLAKIENNQTQLKKVLEQYFGLSTGGSTGDMGSMPVSSSGGSGGTISGGFSLGGGAVGGISQTAPISTGPQFKSSTYRQTTSGGLGSGIGGTSQTIQGQSQMSSGGTTAFLVDNKNMNDPAVLRKMIAELEAENKKLKQQQDQPMSQQFSSSMNLGTRQGARGGEDKNWMNFGSAPLERPTTANTSNQRVNELMEELKMEKKDKKRLFDEIESLKKELQKSNFSAFTQSSGQISLSAGRLPQVPGVREITLEDIEIGDQISQGGFSVIHKGFLNGSPVAIKKIFDPRLTEDLLYEIYNEIVMQSILRHPNITLLMGVMPKIPNIVIVFELMAFGSLYNLLHLKKTTQLSMDERLRIARDVAVVYHYMHSLGIVHRDLKSHNILIDENYKIKVCDFGLARFKADLNKGTMQYSGTPAYMAPELFQKRQYDESVDIFAYGTLLWELVCREVPYDGFDPADIRAKVEKEEQLKVPYGTDPRIAQLIADCRQTNTANRPRFDRILEMLSYIVK